MGRYTFLLAEQGIRVEGLDLSAQLLEKMREHNTEGYDIPLHPFDLLDCPPEMHEQFDAVVGFFVLHHVHDLQACFSAAAKLVRPAGKVAFLEPNPSNPLYYAQIFATPEMSWKGERGMRNMRKELLYPAMERSGLRPTSFVRFGFFPLHHQPSLGGPIGDQTRAGSCVAKARTLSSCSGESEQPERAGKQRLTE